MPKFEGGKSKGDGDDDKHPLVVPEQWTEPRCHVCTSTRWRKVIETLIAVGTPYSQIERETGGEIDRRSIANHAEKHLNWHDAAIKRIIDKAAEEADEAAEEGIKGIVARRVYMEVALEKAYHALLSGDVTVEPKDALALIQELERQDTKVGGVAMDEMRMQFQAFLQAIREIRQADIERLQTVDDLHKLIFQRTSELIKNTSGSRDTPQLDA